MSTYYTDDQITLYHGDALDVARQLPASTADCIVTSPPFSGSGTTGIAAQRTGRRYTGIDLNADYLDLSLKTRLRQPVLDFGAEP